MLSIAQHQDTQALDRYKLLRGYKMKIIVFTSSNCPSCVKLCKELEQNNVKFEKVNVENGAQMSEYLEIPIGSLPTTIAFNNEMIYRMWVGFSNGILREIKGL